MCLAAVDIHVITAPPLRLDREPHRARLLETARRVRPRLLLLDPLVRLRGSSDIHAFGDSNLYLRRNQDRLLLASEHRAAPAAPPVWLELVAADPELTHLAVVAEREEGQHANLQQQVLTLFTPGQVLTRASLRDTLAVKNERLGQALESLENAGQIRRTAAGWQRAE